MDLNAAIKTAEAGLIVRDDATMALGWTVRYVKPEKLLYYFDPKNEKRHKINFSDAQRASFRWRIVDAAELKSSTVPS